MRYIVYVYKGSRTVIASYSDDFDEAVNRAKDFYREGFEVLIYDNKIHDWVKVLRFTAF